MTAPLGGLYGHGMYMNLACSPYEILTEITFGTAKTFPPAIQYIRLDCEKIDSHDGGAHKYPAILSLPGATGTNSSVPNWSRHDFSNVTLTNLTSSRGFNSASVYTSASSDSSSLGTETNPITQITFGSVDGGKVSGGSQVTITGDLVQEESFDIPSNARIYGLDLYYQTYINGFRLKLVCPDQVTLRGSGYPATGL